MKKTIVILFGVLLFSLQAICQDNTIVVQKINMDSIQVKSIVTHLYTDSTCRCEEMPHGYSMRNDVDCYVIDGIKLNDSVSYIMNDLYSPFPDFGYVFYTIPRSTRKDISHFTEYGYHYSSQDIRKMANWTDLLGEKL